MEKIPHQKVCRPGRLQFRKTVKNIKGVISLFFDDIVDLHCKGLEAVR